jgi:hypothetical protein
MNTLAHIQALQAASLDLEAQLRANNFTTDCAKVNDAVRRGQKHGFALLFDEDGNAEAIPLGEKAGAIEVAKGKEAGHYAVTYGESQIETWKSSAPRSKKQRKDTQHMIEETREGAYGQINGENWEKAKSRSHEPGNRTAGHFNPQVHSGPKPATADGARLRQMSADAKRFSEQQYSRNARIVAAMKSRSAEIHK